MIKSFDSPLLQNYRVFTLQKNKTWLCIMHIDFKNTVYIMEQAFEYNYLRHGMEW